jgi:hypothetical protein
MTSYSYEVESALLRLNRAIERRRTLATSLSLWSQFVRLRDSNRCVRCSSTEKLSAHHICRKSFLAEAQLQTGNGITLCAPCHRDIHAGFNGKPNLAFPMDHENGEKIEVLAVLYGELLRDAIERQVLRDDFYFLSDRVINVFKGLQGFDANASFSGTRLEQAYIIWHQCPQNMLGAVLKAILSQSP